MSLKLIDKSRTSTFDACGVKFKARTLSLQDRERFLVAMMDMKAVDGFDGAPYTTMLNILCEVIVGIEGFEDRKPFDVLNELEDMNQLREIATGVLNHCQLDQDEVKNSSCLSEQHIAAPASNVEAPAQPEEERASTK